MTNYRCPYCNKLLFRGKIKKVEIKCSRCKKIVVVRGNFGVQ